MTASEARSTGPFAGSVRSGFRPRYHCPRSAREPFINVVQCQERRITPVMLCAEFSRLRSYSWGPSSRCQISRQVELPYEARSLSPWPDAGYQRQSFPSSTCLDVAGNFQCICTSRQATPPSGAESRASISGRLAKRTLRRPGPIGSYGSRKWKCVYG